MGILDFLALPGQERTRLRDEYLGGLLNYYLGPTGIPERLGLVDMLNPVSDVGRAMTSSQEMLAPGRTPMERVGAGATMLTDIASVAAPSVATRIAGGDATQSMVEGLLGTPVAVEEAGRRVAERLNQPGPVPTMYSNPLGRAGVQSTDPAIERGQEVLQMLRSGRASEITDDMLDMGDPVLNARLNMYLYDNYDLPMDEASRAVRAREMGFDLGGLLTHGSKRDIYGFSLDAPKSTDFGWYGQGISLAPNDPRISDAYAMVEKEGVGRWAGRTYPVTSKGRTYEWPATNPPATSLEQSKEITQSLRDLGYERANIYAPDDPDVWGPAAGSWREQVVYDPRNIRSRFARFDPRLAHLRNLSAGIGGLSLLSTQTPEQRDEEIRQYLGGLL